MSHSVFSYTLEITIKGRERKSIADEIVPWKGEMTVNLPDFLPLYVSTHNTGKWHSEPLINLLFSPSIQVDDHYAIRNTKDPGIKHGVRRGKAEHMGVCVC
jgi:hypothetical protein